MLRRSEVQPLGEVPTREQLIDPMEAADVVVEDWVLCLCDRSSLLLWLFLLLVGKTSMLEWVSAVESNVLLEI